MNVVNMDASINKNKLSVESYKKMNRARWVSFLMEMVTMKANEKNNTVEMLAPHVFGYISEDVCFVLNEVKRMGLCDDFENKKEEVDRSE